ncbi:unnamed protein product [Closterium sp. NIES-53]
MRWFQLSPPSSLPPAPPDLLAALSSLLPRNLPAGGDAPATSGLLHPPFLGVRQLLAVPCDSIASQSYPLPSPPLLTSLPQPPFRCNASTTPGTASALKTYATTSCSAPPYTSSPPILIPCSIPQCSDGWDELNCFNHTCQPGQIHCPLTGYCAKGRLCDGTQDCWGGMGIEDENPEFCEGYVCPEGWWKCADGLQCVEASRWCDGAVNCLDGSDEGAVCVVATPLPPPPPAAGNGSGGASGDGSGASNSSSASVVLSKEEIAKLKKLAQEKKAAAVAAKKQKMEAKRAAEEEKTKQRAAKNASIEAKIRKAAMEAKKKQQAEKEAAIAEKKRKRAEKAAAIEAKKKQAAAIEAKKKQAEKAAAVAAKNKATTK